MNELYKKALYKAISPIVIFTPEEILFKNEAFENLFPNRIVHSVKEVMDEADYNNIISTLENEGSIETLRRFPESNIKNSLLIRAYVVYYNKIEKAYFFHMPTFINQDSHMNVFMRNIFDYSKLAIAMTDEDGKILSINQTFCDWLGYTESELLDTEVKEISHPSDSKREERAFQGIKDGHSHSYQVDKRYAHKDGHFLWGETSVSTIIQAGNKSKFIGVVQDITQRKEMELKLLRKTKELELLSRFSDKFLDEMDITKLIEFVQKDVSTHFNLDGVGVYLLDQSHEMLILHSSIGLCNPPVENMYEYAIEGTFSESCINRKQSIYIPVERYEGTKYLRSSFMEKGFNHLGFFPIATSERVFGILMFGQVGVVPLEEYEVKIINSICNQLALYFSKMDLFEKAQLEAFHRQQAEMDIQYFFQTSVDYLCTATVDGYFKKVSSKFMEELGWTEEELLTRPITSFILNRNFTSGEETIQYLKDQEFVGPLVYHFKCKNGDVKILEWNARFVAERNLIVASARDITHHMILEDELRNKRVEAETAKKELEENLYYLKNMLDSVEGAICVIDENGEIISINGKLLTRSKIDYQAYVGQSVNILSQRLPDYVAAVHMCLKEKCVTKSSFDSPNVAVDIVCTPLIKGTGESFGVVCLGIDVTARKRLEKDLIRAKEVAEHADRLKGQFLANLSHEIRTPLHSVIGFSELLKGSLNDPKFNNYVKAIHASGTILLDLINNLLDLSKIEVGMMTLELADASLVNIIEELRVVFESQALKKGILFKTSLENIDGVVFLLDELRLKQVLVNLISNAIKFTDNGYVKVHVSYKEENLEIIVEDTGIGIPKEDQGIIFNSFAQQSGQSNRKYGGTGLGVSISKALVELMSGKIHLESRVDEGSRFIIRIPNVKCKKIKVSEFPIECPDENNPLVGAKILIYKEDELCKLLLQDYLANTQAQLYFTNNNLQAIQLLEEVVPDLVVTDLILPGMENFNFIHYIKSDPYYKYIPILCITALYGVYSEEQIFEAGYTGYLPKPVQSTELRKNLGDLLKNSKVNHNAKTPVQHIVPSFKIDAQLGIELTVNIIDPIVSMGSNIHINGVRNIHAYLHKKSIETGNAFYSYYHRLLEEALLNYDFIEIQKILFQLKVATRKLLHYHLEKVEN